MIGTVFGKLTVKEVVTPTKAKCLCECGTEVVVAIYKLRSGNNRSCGCMVRLTRERIGDLNKTHGMANSRISGYKSRSYGIWQAMKDRCTNKNRDDFHRYGGRGISVCASWAASFEQFLADMGEPPEGLTLERKNTDGNYELSNCEWATRLTQGRNNANVKYLTLRGETKPLWKWIEDMGMPRGRYYTRLRAGWTQEEAIFGKELNGKREERQPDGPRRVVETPSLDEARLLEGRTTGT